MRRERREEGEGGREEGGGEGGGRGREGRGYSVLTIGHLQCVFYDRAFSSVASCSVRTWSSSWERGLTPASRCVFWCVRR